MPAPRPIARTPAAGPPPDDNSPPVARKLLPATPKPPVPRIVIFGVEGFGKTTIGAYADDPVVLMARGETGYETLLSAGSVPAAPAVLCESWKDTLAWLDAIAAAPQGRKTLVMDAIGGFERLCHEEVCRRDFHGEWGEKGFAAYAKGYDLSVTDWLGMLQRLDRLRSVGMTIVLLGHARIRPFKNPEGADFDRYECDCHAKTWAATSRWADEVYFGKFRTIIDRERQGKGKGIGGADRVLYTQRRDAYDAKSRYGLPEELELNAGPAQSWTQVRDHIFRH